MLRRIKLQNFKASRALDLRLAPLTMLSGMNSSGKSSLLQALALLKQSYGGAELNSIRLSGELVQLGRFRDVLTQNANNDTVSIGLTEDDTEYMWSFQGARDDNQLSLSQLPERPPSPLLDNDFQFLQADRLVPRTLYPQASHQTRQTGFLGSHGEYTVGYLADFATKEVSNARAFPKTGIGLSEELLAKIAPTSGLLDQVSGWMQQLSPGARINVPQNIRGTDEVALQFGYVGLKEEATADDQSFRPTNVGFGLTYSLPVIVSCLAAANGSLILLENPEAHLHPQGQAALGILLARCASDGVQVIVETHSDHLLNGVRLAIKNRLLSHQAAVVHFFERDVESGDASVQSPAISETGRLSNWPVGFFDQWERDLDALLA